MKAIVYRQYGSPDVLTYEDIPRPVPGDNQILIKVCAASINPLDWKVMKGGPFIIRLLLRLGGQNVKRPGVDVAGEVEAAGANVTQFQRGDKVFGTCVGSFAEYAVSKSVTGMKSELVLKPDSVTFEQAASAPVAALTALQALRDKGRIRAGQTVLINGAAGGVGTFAVQIAKSFGANVTGVCSTRNVEMVRSIGADRTIDYTRQDFTTGRDRYDIVFDCVGNRSLSQCRRALNPKGILVMVGVPGEAPLLRFLARLLGAFVWSPFTSRKMLFFIASIKERDLIAVGDLIAAGKVAPVIDRCYPLNRAREAFEYMEQGHARGKVIIKPEHQVE
jgi:NADPH:quinone reductase-like Zn-dependent oxidoreductase